MGGNTTLHPNPAQIGLPTKARFLFSSVDFMELAESPVLQRDAGRGEYCTQALPWVLK